MILLVTACSWSCAIEDGEEVVLTGGVTGGGMRPKITETTVTRYNIQGQATHLPSLNTARYHHACGSYHLPDLEVSCSNRWLVDFKNVADDSCHWWVGWFWTSEQYRGRAYSVVLGSAPTCPRI